MENMRFLIQTIAPSASNSVSRTAAGREGPGQASQSFQNQAVTRLPKLQLPTFSGDKLAWPNFWDSFEVNVHSRPNLPNKQKMDFLFQCLKEAAYDKVKGLGLQGDRYEDAVNILKAAYGGPDDIKMASWEALAGMPLVKPSLENLEKFIDDARAITTSLERMGTDQAALQAYVPLLFKKLPGELHKNVSQFALLKDQEITSWTMSEFLAALTKILKWQAKDVNTRKVKRVTSTESEITADMPATAAFLQATSKQKSVPKRCCIFCCASNHYSDNCPQVTDVAQRIEVARIKKVCFECLQVGHMAKSCKRIKPCYHCKSNKHNSAFCRRHERTPTPQSSQHITSQGELSAGESQEQLSPQEALQVHLAGSGEQDGVIMSCFPCFAKSVHSKVNHTIQLYLDAGARFTCIAKETADRMGLKPLKKVDLETARFNSKVSERVSAEVVQFVLCGPKGFQLQVYAYSIKEMAPKLPLYPVSFDESTKVYLQKLKPLNFPPSKKQEIAIDILLGMDYWHQVMGPQALTKALPIGHSMALYYTPLGVILSGNYLTKFSPDLSSQRNHFLFLQARAQPEPDIQQFWDLEALGLRSADQETVEENQFYKVFKDTVVQDSDGRYYVRWPWKDLSSTIESNYVSAKRRLHGTLRTLAINASNTDHLKAYDNIIQDQLTKGVIEQVPEQPDGPITHFIAHFPVIKKDRRTTKVRIVYDASARTPHGGPSLNDLIYTGTNYIQNLIGLLLRFRLAKIAITSDIEKAFLQIGLQKVDRDSVRFFWIKQLLNPWTDNNIVVYRFARIPFGVVASPYLLGATINHHLDCYPCPLADHIRANTYMDNIFLTANTTAEALDVYTEAKNLFAKAAMNLREFTSNDQQFISLLPDKDKVTDHKAKVLGITWSTATDIISAKEVPTFTAENTKREILKYIAQLFDPLGYLSPATIRGKILIQTLWKQKVQWDDPLPPHCNKEWLSISTTISQASRIQLPRYISVCDNYPLNLVCFTDASQVAYAATVFLCQDQPSKTSHLLFAKARVAPLKSTLTLPRLELTAVLLGVRLLSFIKPQLPCTITSTSVFTDSQIVLQWLFTDKALPPYVARRINEIKSAKEVYFGHVGSKENPADLATRGTKNSDLYRVLQENGLWFKGPSWLCLPKSKWPSQLRQITTENNPVASTTLMVYNEQASNSEYSPFSVILQRSQSLSKLLRITSYCMRFISACKSQPLPLSVTITVSEIQASRRYWIQIAQKEYQDHKASISSGRPTQFVKQLDLFLQDDVIRCGGRVANAFIDVDAKFPILLPKSHIFTKLVILDAHNRVHHFGARATLAEVRRQFWIPQGLSGVKKVIARCYVCQRTEGGPLKPPKMAPLPRERLSMSPAFTFTGLDYLGPLHIKSCRKAAYQKRWICIFTCLSTRAVHLEIVADCATTSAINAVKRLIARRGCPESLLSDNAPQFKKAAGNLRTICNPNDAGEASELKSFLANKEITWRFIPEGSPWCGGFYERLISLVKRALRKILWKARISEDSLQTVVCEIEGTLNSRPLLQASPDFKDSKVLTPADFIAPSTRLTIPPLVVSPRSPNDLSKNLPMSSAYDVLKYYKICQEKLQTFWKLWQTYYLQELRGAQGNYFKRKKR